MVSNRGNVSRYLNSGYSSSQQTDPSVGLSGVTVSNNNGILRCQFNRTKYEPGVSHYYSLYSSAYVLLAKGVLAGSKIKCIFYYFKSTVFNRPFIKDAPQQHSISPIISDSMIQFHQNGAYSASAASLASAKAHGKFNS